MPANKSTEVTTIPKQGTQRGLVPKKAPPINRVWGDAVKRALLRSAGPKKGKNVDALAKALLKKALSGDVPALKEIGDRVDGKAVQQMEVKADINFNISTTDARL